MNDFPSGDASGIGEIHTYYINDAFWELVEECSDHLPDLMLLEPEDLYFLTTVGIRW